MSAVDELIKMFILISGKSNVFTFSNEVAHYGMDQTMNLKFDFDILIKPSSAKEISEILRICNKYKIPVTPRGGGSGVTGGALPIQKGVVLSLERLNKIISIDKINNIVIAESGVITQILCNFIKDNGLYFPISPTSSAYSFIGGNVAENAGSINSCKYGTTAQYVLNLEVVLVTGEIIWTGFNVGKNATGLNLTQLFVGSEGVLGIITKVVYKLLPLVPYETVLLAGFESIEDAYAAIIAIKQSNIIPSGVELIGEQALKITSEYIKHPLPLIEKNVHAHLIVSLEESSTLQLESSFEKTIEIIEKYTNLDILIGNTAFQKESIWKLRLNIGNALTDANWSYRDIDICVPLSSLLEYIKAVEVICKKHGLVAPLFGHGLDGNLHTMLVFDKLTIIENEVEFQEAIKEIYLFAIKNGGVISGEHGIGLLQKTFMPIQFSDKHLSLMKNIKLVFDPNSILNPGKIL